MPKGGARKGAGRPPRTDGRTKRVVIIVATDAEQSAILSLSTDERREALLAKAREGCSAADCGKETE